MDAVLLLLALLTSGARAVDAAVLRCSQVEKVGSPVFQLVRMCSRSAMSVVAQANVTSAGRCADLAASRRGLAFNYSPRSAPRGHDGQFSSSCLVLDCPEFEELSSLQRDEAYDYYSLFTAPLPRAGWSCVPGVGMFQVRGHGGRGSELGQRANHSAAADRCAEDDGALAHVLSEARTAGLSTLLATKSVDAKNRTLGPVNRAFVDLDDTAQEGLFVTSADEPLDCFPFRAWAPGEPRNRSATDDCVVLEKKRSWAVTDCRKRLPYICELYPGRGGDCDHDDDEAREACLEMRRLRGTPDDRCAGWDILAVPPPQPTTTAAPITPEYEGDDDDDDGAEAGQGDGDEDSDEEVG